MSDFNRLTEYESIAGHAHAIPVGDPDVAMMALAAYEDTGMTPEEIKSLIAYANGKAIGEITEFDGVSITQLKELVKAEKEERLVLLPCKPLDTVYSLFCNEIVEKRIVAITINGYSNPRIWVELDCSFLATQIKRWDLAVGKDFYLTREEAEAALKEKNE